MISTDSPNVFSKRRVFRAPRDLVIKMWSDPNLITKWWGPNGFTTTTHEMDFRRGGIWRYTMHGPDGTDYPNLVEYVETGPDRISYHHGDGKSFWFDVVVDLSETESGDTEMNFQMIFPSAEVMQKLLDESGAGEGLTQTLQRLAALIDSGSEKLDMGPIFESSVERTPEGWALVLVRDFEHPTELVWRALTEPEMVSQWAPYLPSRNLGEVGPATIEMTDGQCVEASMADVLEVESGRLLVHYWGDNLLRWELETTESGTRLTLRHSATEKGWLPVFAAGWHMCLVVADRLLAGRPVGPIVGMATKDYGWDQLHDQYAENLNIDSVGFPREMLERSDEER